MYLQHLGSYIPGRGWADVGEITHTLSCPPSCSHFLSCSFALILLLLFPLTCMICFVNTISVRNATSLQQAGQAEGCEDGCLWLFQRQEKYSVSPFLMGQRVHHAACNLLSVNTIKIRFK